MAIYRELTLRLPNSPGALSGVCRLLGDERVNILALALESSGLLRVVVDNHVHGGAVLREHHHQVAERDVILTRIPNTPGSAAGALQLAADGGVNVEYAYGGVDDGSFTATVVIGVEDAERAAAASGL